jgi:hypothetical protein
MERLNHLPIIPTSILRRYHVHAPLDHRFRGCARLLQSIWRFKRGFQMGSYTTPSGFRYRLGSRLGSRAAAAGANFVNQDIARLVRREAAYREPGAFIDEDRLWSNLLSSVPLCFNIFGPLKLDLGLASRVISGLHPALGDFTVRAILFEHAPARGDPAVTGDHTAWDAFVVYSRPSGAHGFVAVECKYSEAPGGSQPELPPRFAAIAAESGLVSGTAPGGTVQRNLQQFYREHLMAQAYLPSSPYSEGHFVVLAPTLNRPMQRTIDRYRRQLVGADAHVPFLSWTLEQVVEQFRAAGADEYAQSLFERYCDWSLVDQELEAAFAVAGSVKTPETQQADLALNAPQTTHGGILAAKPRPSAKRAGR